MTAKTPLPTHRSGGREVSPAKTTSRICESVEEIRSAIQALILVRDVALVQSHILRVGLVELYPDGGSIDVFYDVERDSVSDQGSTAAWILSLVPPGGVDAVEHAFSHLNAEERKRYGVAREGGAIVATSAGYSESVIRGVAAAASMIAECAFWLRRSPMF